MRCSHSGRERSPTLQEAAAASVAPPPAVEDGLSWAKRQVKSGVSQQRCSEKAAKYFEEMLQEMPELHGCADEAKRLMGGNEPHSLTRYQQSQFLERFTLHTSAVASERLMATRREESSTQRFTQDGTPTGENYWMEAGNLLASPTIPSLVKDELLKDLQQERTAASPAFKEPEPDQFAPLQDENYAEHLRRQKRRLLEGSDTLFYKSGDSLKFFFSLLSGGNGFLPLMIHLDNVQLATTFFVVFDLFMRFLSGLCRNNLCYA
eukprot:gene12523-8577_t